MKLFKKKSKQDTSLPYAKTLKAFRNDYLNKNLEKEKARTIDWVNTKLANHIITLAKAGASGHDCVVPEDINRNEVIKMLSNKGYEVDYFGGNSISIYWE